MNCPPNICSQRGLSLIELLVIIVIIGIITVVAMQSMTATVDDMRRAATDREMQSLAAAIVGDPSVTSGGVRSDFGYVGDVGAFPPDLNALRSNPGGYTTWDGPYLPPGFAQDTIGFKTDEWGEPYAYTGGVTITSNGSGTAITHSIARNIADYLSNNFAGFIADADGSPPGSVYCDSIKVVLTCPDGAGGRITTTTRPDSAGGFSFAGLPVGQHPMQVIYEPMVDTLHRYITVLPRNRTDPPEQYRFASAPFGSANGGCIGPGADTLRPVAAGSIDNLTSNGCSAAWQCVDDVMADDDGSYVESGGTVWTTAVYAISTPADTSCTITDVTVWIQARRFVKNADARVAIQVDGSAYEGATTALSDDYSTVSATWLTNPATGSPWTWSDMTALQAGVSLKSSKSTHAARCTQVEVIVSYGN